jgi:hypothetical protein
MNAVLFDTHAFVKRLTAVGMPEAQAEVLADEQARLIDERLATKADFRELGASVKAQIAELATKSEVKADIAEAKADILKWMFGTIGFQTLVLLGAAVALAKALH